MAERGIPTGGYSLGLIERLFPLINYYTTKSYIAENNF